MSSGTYKVDSAIENWENECSVENDVSTPDPTFSWKYGQREPKARKLGAYFSVWRHSPTIPIEPATDRLVNILDLIYNSTINGPHEFK